VRDAALISMPASRTLRKWRWYARLGLREKLEQKEVAALIDETMAEEKNAQDHDRARKRSMHRPRRKAKGHFPSSISDCHDQRQTTQPRLEVARSWRLASKAEPVMMLSGKFVGWRAARVIGSKWAFVGAIVILAILGSHGPVFIS